MKPFGGQRLLSAGTGRWRTGFDSWVPVLFLASGAAGLIYQVVWTQDLVLIFGDTTLAIVTTVWRYLSHAQHMGDRFLVGYPLRGRWHRPVMDVVSNRFFTYAMTSQPSESANVTDRLTLV